MHHMTNIQFQQAWNTQGLWTFDTMQAGVYVGEKNALMGILLVCHLLKLRKQISNLFWINKFQLAH